MDKKRPLQIVTLYYVEADESNNPPRAKYQRNVNRPKTGIVKSVKVRIKSQKDFEREYNEYLPETSQEPPQEEIVYTEEETESIIRQYEKRQKEIIDIESTNFLETPVDTPRRLSIDQDLEKFQDGEAPPKVDICLPSTSHTHDFSQRPRVAVILNHEMPPLIFESMPPFNCIESNLYTNKMQVPYEAKAVRCLCNPLDLKEGIGCGESCMNRKLKMECPNRCPTGDFCSNKRFKKRLYKRVTPNFMGLEDRWGLFAEENIEKDQFIIEFVGEVINQETMIKRKIEYFKDPKHKDTYHLKLKNGFYIDATTHGNISRFISQSEDPNCELQSWTVDRHVRLGFFSIKSIQEHEEITCDFRAFM